MCWSSVRPVATSWACAVLVAACGAEAASDGTGGSAVCAAGQASGCICADGSAPQTPDAQAGCASSLPAHSGTGVLAAVAGASAGRAGAQALDDAAVSAMAARARSGNAAGGVAAATTMGGAGAAESGEAAPSMMPVAGGGAGAAGAFDSPAASGGVAGAMAADAAAAGAAGTAAADGTASSLDCAGGTVGKASNGGGVQGRGNGNVQFTVDADNQIVRMRTTLAVPGKPNGNTTLFLWPGLEPIQGSDHYSPIGTGVLQPVLTWGGSCAPGSIQTRQGSHWWISAQYVNTLGSDQDHRGCYGGPVMDVESGDLLDIDMVLTGTIWTQTVTSRMSGESVDFDMDLEMQEQRWALFEIEMPTNTKPAEDVVFTNTVIEFEKAAPAACKASARGADDYFSAPVASTDGMRCCVDRIVLRVAGAKATGMDPPPP